MKKRNKKFIVVLLISIFILLTSCTKENIIKEDEYQIVINDIRNIRTYNSKIKLKDSLGNLLADLKANFHVVEQNGFIVSIEDTIVDKNYFLSIKVNDKISEVGASEIIPMKNDIITIENICWNQELDATDLLIDYCIYKKLADLKTYAKEVDKFYDYSLASAIYQMIKLYGESFFKLEYLKSDKLTSLITNFDFNAINETNVNDLMKLYIATVIQQADQTKLKNYMLETTYLNAFSVITLKGLKIEKNYQDLISIPKTGGDYSNMLLPIAKLVYSVEEIGMDTINETIKNLTSSGVDEYGINGASTALLITSLCEFGINPRTVKVEDVDLMQILLKYYNDDMSFNWKLEDENPDLIFTTNQAFTALFAYKAVRDLNCAFNLYDYS